MSDKNRVVLAYSGGLDTSVICHWLARKGYEVICCAVDVGQGDDFDTMGKKAFNSGAKDFVIRDVKEKFVREGLFWCMQAQARYEGEYIPCTAIARPFIMKEVVGVAHDYGAGAVAHGATAKGNDQVRFDFTVFALDNNLEIIAPWRDTKFVKLIPGRKEAIEYARCYHIHIAATAASPWSSDKNIGHASHEAGILENPWQAPPDDLFELVNLPWKLQGTACTDIIVAFEKGVPVAVNGTRNDALTIMRWLNAVASSKGIGLYDIVEDRILGMKSRGVYEAPGMTLLYGAYRALQQICLDKEDIHKSLHLGIDYGRDIYEGWWYSNFPKKKRHNRIIKKWREAINGKVRMRLFRGNFLVIGRSSPNSLYSEQAGTMERDDDYDVTKVAEIIKDKWKERNK